MVLLWRQKWYIRLHTALHMITSSLSEFNSETLSEIVFPWPKRWEMLKPSQKSLAKS